MSAAKVENPPPQVEHVDDDDVPTLETADHGAEEAASQPAGGKQGKRYAKAMAKMGLKPEPNIVKVQIRKHKGLSFAIASPEVYRFPGTNTFVIFGDTQLDDAEASLQEAAARAVSAAGGFAKEGPAASTTVEEVSEEAGASSAEAAAPGATAEPEDEDPGTLQEKEIKVVMSQAGVTRGRAIQALKANKGDIVNAIMELTM